MMNPSRANKITHNPSTTVIQAAAAAKPRANGDKTSHTPTSRLAASCQCRMRMMLTSSRLHMVLIFVAASACDNAAGELALAARWRHAFRPLRQLVLGVEPRGAVRSPDVHFGPCGDRRIETAHPKQDGVLALARGDDMRAALGAKIPRLARRGFKTSEQAFTPDPATAIAGAVGYGR